MPFERFRPAALDVVAATLSRARTQYGAEADSISAVAVAVIVSVVLPLGKTYAENSRGTLVLMVARKAVSLLLTGPVVFWTVILPSESVLPTQLLLIPPEALFISAT